MKKPVIIIASMFIAVLSYASEGLKLNSEIRTNVEVSDKTLNLAEGSEFELFNKKRKPNRRSERPIGVNIMAFGPGGLAGVSMDGFLTPKFALEGGAGLRSDLDRLDFEADNFSYFIGARYHLFGGTRLNLTPYVGAYTAFHYTGTDVQNHKVYFPLGIHRIKKSGFNWGAEVAFQKSANTDRRLSGSFRIGYRF